MHLQLTAPAALGPVLVMDGTVPLLCKLGHKGSYFHICVQTFLKELLET